MFVKKIYYILLCCVLIIFVLNSCMKDTNTHDMAYTPESVISVLKNSATGTDSETLETLETPDITESEVDETTEIELTTEPEITTAEETEFIEEITVEIVEIIEETTEPVIEPTEIADDDIGAEDIVEEELAEMTDGELTEILISAIGDCSLASNYVKPYANSFYNYYDSNGAAYFFENVLPVLANDDLTVANLESALTDSENRVNKQYCYKGKKEYSNILVEGSVEVVNLENNHIFDYSQEGYDDTIESLKAAGIDYFGNGGILIKEVKGIKIGFIGFMGSSDVSNWRLQIIKNALSYLDENGADIKIVSFHWGNVDEKIANENQRILAHFAIDNGADLILGHHPHVLQGIEIYRDKYIVYSLGNFIFDGNMISDEDHRTSIIFQQKFILRDNIIIDSSTTIIPVHATSNLSRNNFQPIIVDGEQKERILKKIEERSK